MTDSRPRLDATGDRTSLEEYRTLVQRAAASIPSGVISNTGVEHARIVVEELFKRAQSEVLIYTESLTRSVYDGADVIRAMLDVLSRKDVRVHVVTDYLPDKDQLILKAIEDRRLSHRVELRRANQDLRGTMSPLAIVDEAHYRFEGDQKDRRRGIVEFGNPQRAQTLKQAFNAVWNASRPLSIDEVLHRQDKPEESDPPHLLVPSVRIISATAALLPLLQRDPGKLASLSPEQFEVLICDRLHVMGFELHKVGHAFAPDGGVDIVARHRMHPFPMLLAVQAKHSSVGRVVRGSVIKDMKAIVQSVPFDAGIVVTNTTFSPDAQWWATHGPGIVRLRDFDDIKRWLVGNFLADCSLSEFPKEIRLGNVVIPVPQD